MSGWMSKEVVFVTAGTVAKHMAASNTEPGL